MKRIAAAIAVLGFVFFAVPACSSSPPSNSAAPSTAASSNTAPASDSATTTTATPAPVSGANTTSFCAMLATGADKTAAFIASIGTPQQAAKLAEIKSDNDAIVAAAPADVRDAIAKFYEISNIARRALDPTLSPADKRTAASAAASAAATPEAKSAIASYKSWVQANCGSLAAKILSAGT